MIFNDNMDEPDIIENINADMLVINDVDDNDKLVNKKPKKRRKDYRRHVNRFLLFGNCVCERTNHVFMSNILAGSLFLLNRKFSIVKI